MSKIMKIEKEIVMKAARECYKGENLENYLQQVSKDMLKSLCKQIQEYILKDLEKENPGKNFIIGKPSLLKSTMIRSIGYVLKGESRI